MEQALSVWAECIARVGDLMTIVSARPPTFVRSVIAPIWEDPGFLAAIAAIRTFLSDFLEKDIEDARSAPGRERIEA